jgi:hypothetical protein
MKRTRQILNKLLRTNCYILMCVRIISNNLTQGIRLPLGDWGIEGRRGVHLICNKFYCYGVRY